MGLPMSAFELALARAAAIIDEIAATQRELGETCREPQDREAFDIVSRMERKLLANMKSSRKSA
jgi:hypothetical protein